MSYGYRVKVKRSAFNLLAAVCLLPCLSTIGMATTAQLRQMLISRAANRRRVLLDIDAKLVALAIASPWPREESLTFQSGRSGAWLEPPFLFDRRTHTTSTLFYGITKSSGWAGASVPHQFRGFFGRVDALMIRWPIAIAAALLPLMAVDIPWLVRFLARRRKRIAGLCPRCSYDLRATPHCCPGCGAVADAHPA